MFFVSAYMLQCAVNTCFSYDFLMREHEVKCKPLASGTIQLSIKKIESNILTRDLEFPLNCCLP